MPKFPTAAFDCFFDEIVAVLSVRDGVSRRVSMPVSVFTDGSADPLVDSLVDSEMSVATMVCRKSDWPFVQSLRRGDSVTREDGSKWQVLSVKREEAIGWTVSIRSVK